MLPSILNREGGRQRFPGLPKIEMDTDSGGFGVWLEWPELSDLCVRAGTTDPGAVIVSYCVTGATMTLDVN